MDTASHRETEFDDQSDDYHHPATVEELTQQNVQTVTRLEQRAREDRTRADQVAEAIAAFCGSMAFVWLHVGWFGVWIAANMLPRFKHFDPFPFTFLTLCVSLEAIFLSTFIMISQNHETRLTERRNHLDLQINLLTEQENTKMMAMLVRIAEKVGAEVDDDPSIKVLEQSTRPDKLAEQIEQAINTSVSKSNEAGA
jgi:uncharacterized membrane protein